MSKPTGYNLDHKITIQYDASDGTSEHPDWKSLFSNPIFAEKQGLSERNFYASGADQSQESATFVFHFSASYYAQIRGSMRLADNGDTARPYKIIGTPVDIYDDRRWLKIHAQRVDANGG